MSISKQDGVVSLANGCVCCSLRGDLINEIKQMAVSQCVVVVCT
jgi:G3E family GTPase